MIIGLTGGMACGKKTFAEFLHDKGFYKLTFSDAISEELAKRGIPVTRKSQQDLGNELRLKYGPGFWAKRLISMTEVGRNYILDGIRNPGEVAELRKHENFILIAIDSPQKLRFQRIVSRNMDRDPKTWKEFLKADARDFDDGNKFGLQIYECMKMADYTVVNDGSLFDFQKRIEEIFEKIKKQN